MLLRGINSSSKLKNQLLQNRNTPNMLLFFGDDTFIRESLIESSREYFRSRGFNSSITFSSDNLKWESVQNELLTHSLLAENQLIILNFADSPIPREFTSNINLIGQAVSPTKALIMAGAHLTKDKEASSWFKKLTSFDNLYFPFYSPKASELHTWFSNEALALDLNLSYDASLLLSEFFEGNLAGGIQALQTCKMQGKTKIERSDLLSFAGDNNFETKDYVDSLIIGNTSKALKVIKAIRATGNDPALIVYELNRIIHFILAIKQAEFHREDTKKIVLEHRIFQGQLNIYHQLSNQTSIPHLNNLIKTLDLVQKYRMEFNSEQAWHNIETLTAFFTSPNQLADYLKIECSKI